jgi:hypothetical protein
MDDAIEGGASWRKRLVDFIEGAEIFVIVLSGHSIRSKEVQTELDLAADAEKPIIPVRIEEVSIPKEMKHSLAGKQWIDFSTNPPAGHEALKAALNAVAVPAPGASFASVLGTLPSLPVLPATPTAKRKTESTDETDPYRAAIEAGQRLSDKYDELIERLDSATPKSLSVILPGEWTVGIGVEVWTFTLERSGVFTAKPTMPIRGPSWISSIEGQWALESETCVQFNPRFSLVAGFFDFTFDEIEGKRLAGTTNFPGRAALEVEDIERRGTSWRRAWHQAGEQVGSMP